MINSCMRSPMNRISKPFPCRAWGIADLSHRFVGIRGRRSISMRCRESRRSCAISLRAISSARTVGRGTGWPFYSRLPQIWPVQQIVPNCGARVLPQFRCSSGAGKGGAARLVTERLGLGSRLRPCVRAWKGAWSARTEPVAARQFRVKSEPDKSLTAQPESRSAAWPGSLRAAGSIPSLKQANSSSIFAPKST